MKYKYKLNNEIEAEQFRGDGIADTIIMDNFLCDVSSEIYYLSNKIPYLKITNKNGKICTAYTADYIIRLSPGNYIAVPYQSFIRLYGSCG